MIPGMAQTVTTPRLAPRPVIIAGNWKMNTTPADAGELARTIGARTRVAGVTRVLCPPFVCLAAVGDALDTADVRAPDGLGVDVGAQDVHPEAAGAFTGWTSAPRACWCWRAARTCTAPSTGCSRRAAWKSATWRWWPGAWRRASR